MPPAREEDMAGMSDHNTPDHMDINPTTSAQEKDSTTAPNWQGGSVELMG